MVDLQSTINAIVDAAKLPISIILVAVGNADRKKFKILDGETNKSLVHSLSGEVCTRDIVQFVPFRRFKNDYKSLTKEILFEVSA